MYLKNNFFKITVIFFFIANTVNCFAQRTLYIDNSKTNTSNNGLTEANAFPNFFRAINAGPQPGDIYLVKNGTGPYTSTTNPPLNITVSGTALAPITFKNYPGHSPVIQTTTVNWQGIYIRGSYIVVDGLTVRGLSASQNLTNALGQGGSCTNSSGALESQYNTNGIQVDGRTSANNTTGEKYHHITIKNCTVYECGGSGIQIIQADYMTIENNRCYNNAWYSIYAPSGISVYQSYNFDSSTATKFFIRNNICYGNRMQVPWPSSGCTFTDGNGIIIDDTKNGQNGSTLGAYTGRTLVANNIVYNNGGSGIHSYASEHVDIVNNTAYNNSQTTTIDNGEIFPQSSNDVRIFNNILYAAAGQKINSNMSNGSGIVYNYNLHFGGGSNSFSASNIITADPQFVNAVGADFTLQSTSPALNVGIASLSGTSAPTTDIIGAARPIGSAHDIGAYERSSFFTNPSAPTKRLSIIVEANNGATIQVSVNCSTGTNVYSKSFTATQQGQNILTMVPTFDTGGVYNVTVTIGSSSETKAITIL